MRYSRQVVSPDLVRAHCQAPTTLPQSAHQRRECVPIRHFRISSARVAQHELEQQVLERLSAYRDAKFSTVREVHLRLASRRMLLLEVQLTIRSVQRPPVPHPLLKRPQVQPAELSGMTLVQPLQDRRRSEYAIHSRLEQGHYLLVSDLCERVQPRPLPAPDLLLRWQRTRSPGMHRPLTHPTCRRRCLLCLAFHKLLPHQNCLSIGDQSHTVRENHSCQPASSTVVPATKVVVSYHRPQAETEDMTGAISRISTVLPNAYLESEHTTQHQSLNLHDGRSYR